MPATLTPKNNHSQLLATYLARTQLLRTLLNGATPRKAHFSWVATGRNDYASLNPKVLLIFCARYRHLHTPPKIKQLLKNSSLLHQTIATYIAKNIADTLCNHSLTSFVLVEIYAIKFGSNFHCREQLPAPMPGMKKLQAKMFSKLQIIVQVKQCLWD